MIEVTQEPSLWVLTLNRPDKANSVTKAMLTTLAETVEAATAAGVAVLVLTGVGRVFSAGADLDDARAGLAVDPVWERLSAAIAAFPGFSIAALNGALAGGSMGMALACDLRISVPGAKFFYPVMKLGFLPQPSDPARLVALVGPARAKLILMAGEKIEAEEALAMGLIDRIVEAEALMQTARGLASDVLAAKPGHAAAIKRMVG
jgi:enoyl-CoA hydratase/carnithine racemase